MAIVQTHAIADAMRADRTNAMNGKFDIDFTARPAYRRHLRGFGHQDLARQPHRRAGRGRHGFRGLRRRVLHDHRSVGRLARLGRREGIQGDHGGGAVTRRTRHRAHAHFARFHARRADDLDAARAYRRRRRHQRARREQAHLSEHRRAVAGSESARTAFELLARDVRQAGNNGCGNTNRIANVLKNSAGWWTQWFGTRLRARRPILPLRWAPQSANA